MATTVPWQHPAVVLRRSYRIVQALLAYAMVVIAVLAITVVLLATDGGSGTAGSSPRQGGAASMAEQAAQRRAAVHGKGTPVHRRGERHGLRR
jgi:hypothetical protein